MSKKITAPAPEVARDLEKEFKVGEIVTLSTGYRAKIKAVASTLLDRVAAKIEDPEIPVQYIEAKGRDEANPLDPSYRAAVRKAQADRGRAVNEALIHFGVDLVDGIPPDEEWMPELDFLIRRGRLDLEEYDISDPHDREFVFKAYVAVADEDIKKVMRACGLLDETVEEAIRTFQREEME
jgi:hypothetical protein